MTGSRCKELRRAIRDRDFVGWKGLEASCGMKVLFDREPGELSELPKRWLGERKRSARFVLLDLGGYYRPMASLRDGELVLFDGKLPELSGGVDPLKRDLGAPEAELDWSYGTVSMEGGEWPYPQRGITIFLNDARDKALHIALYRPTTLEVYRQELRPSLRKKPRPL